MSRFTLPDPPDELKLLSESLCAVIRDEIMDHGVIPFSRYMEMALYQPGLGYYSAGLHKLGETGDFVTSPELGSLFAAQLHEVLAAHAAEPPHESVYVGNARIGTFLKEQVFSRSALYPWHELVGRATGAPLSPKAFVRRVTDVDLPDEGRSGG